MKNRSSFGRNQGFTLVEMLTVLAIMAILILLVAPSLKGVMRAYQLTVTGQTVIGQLNLARQTALAGNHAVQVRFYELPDYSQSASSTFTTTTGIYRGMQCFQEGDLAADGSSATVPLTPITKPIFFTAPVVAMIATTNTSVSSLLSSPQTPLAADSTQSLPGYGQNYKYMLLRFKSGGGTNLTTANNCVTFMLENDKITDTINGLPANYLTITIDPVTGTLQLYRP